MFRHLYKYETFWNKSQVANPCLNSLTQGEINGLFMTLINVALHHDEIVNKRVWVCGWE
jgi:hypothetical protein